MILFSPGTVPHFHCIRTLPSRLLLCTVDLSIRVWVTRSPIDPIVGVVSDLLLSFSYSSVSTFTSTNHRSSSLKSPTLENRTLVFLSTSFVFSTTSRVWHCQAVHQNDCTGVFPLYFHFHTKHEPWRSTQRDWPGSSSIQTFRKKTMVVMICIKTMVVMICIIKL